MDFDELELYDLAWDLARRQESAETSALVERLEREEYNRMGPLRTHPDHAWMEMERDEARFELLWGTDGYAYSDAGCSDDFDDYGY